VQKAAGQPPGAVARAQDFRDLAVRLADVQRHGFVKFQRNVQLRLERLQLFGPGRQVVVVVQADFAQAHGLRVREEALQPFGGFGVPFGRGVRVHADGGVQKIIGLAQFERVGRVGLVRRLADHHREVDAALPHSLQHLIKVRLEALVGQVAVGVEQVHQRISMPLGKPPSMVASFRLPSSSEAHRIMPWLITPRIFRGARFATSTTVFPTISSGE